MFEKKLTTKLRFSDNIELEKLIKGGERKLK